MKDKIRAILSKYTYGKSHLIGADIRITLDLKKKEGRITHFFCDGELEGDCIELSKTLQSDLARAIPGLSTRIVEGNAPYVFVPSTGYHYFIIAYESNQINRVRDIKDLEKLNPLLIDPSLGIVDELKSSGYLVTDIVVKGAEEYPFESTLYLEDGVYAPLGLTTDMRLIKLKADFKTRDVLMIWIQDEPTELPLDSPELRNTLNGESKILQLIDYIHAKNTLASRNLNLYPK